MESDATMEVRPLLLQGVPPSPREAHSMLALPSRRILVFGGGCMSPLLGPQQFNDLFLLDLNEASWSPIPSTGLPPIPRTGQSAVLLDDSRVLLFGGSSMATGYMNDVHLLDTKEWRWSTPEVTGNAPSPRDKHTACLLGDKLYIFGGFGPSTAENTNGDAVSEDEDEASASSADDEVSSEEEDEPSLSFVWFGDIHVLDITSMEWQELKTRGAKPSPRAAHTAFVARLKDDDHCELREKLIVFGGRDSIGRVNDLFSLDLKTLEWRKETAKHPPPPRSFHVMLPLSGSQKAVCYGGIGAQGEHFVGLKLLNLETLQWTSLSRCKGTWPPLRGASAMVSCSPEPSEGAQLVIFGGSRNLEDSDTTYFNDVYVISLTL